VILDLLATSAFATLSFASLTGTPDSRTAQKEVIVQALRTAFPQPSAFIEESSDISLDFETEMQHTRLKVFCVRCTHAESSDVIDSHSVTFSSLATGRPGGTQIELTFTTGTGGLTSETKNWAIRIDLELLRFGIFTQSAMEKGQEMSNGLSSVRPCLPPSTCRASETHATFADAIAQTNRLIGQIARRSIPFGQQITAEEFLHPNIISKGNPVSLVLSTQSGLLIRTPAAALADGRTGETIPVRISGQTHRTVRARIRNSKEVEYAQ
jgi:flagella basal body P-ring formation protein FlgA